MSRRGLTLFEILLSVLILSVVVLTAMALLPKGIEAEIHARSKLYASAIAMNFMDSFHKPGFELDVRADTDFIHYGRNKGYPTTYDPDDAALSREYDGRLHSNAGFTDVDVINLVTSDQVQPSFSIGLRNAAWFSSAKGHDFEHALANRYMGMIPLPPEIARRLVDERGEIQQILDQGGYLYYAHPEAVRGMTANATQTFGRAGQGTGFDRVDEAMHRLVFAVVTPAQQNVLPTSPWDTAPLYEMYPFPPQWKSMGGDTVWEHRLLTNGSGGIQPKDVTNMWDTKRDWKNPYVIFGKGAYLGLRLGTPPELIHTAVDPYDFDAIRDDLESEERRSGYHGRNWRYFAEQEVTAGYTAADANSRRKYKWAAGWVEFCRLAHNANAGWLPLTGGLDLEAKYEGQETWGNWGSTAGDIGAHTAEQDAFGNSSSSVKDWWNGSSGYGVNKNTKWKTDKWNEVMLNLMQKTQKITATVTVPTYEMRASYRDHALRLWEAVRPIGVSSTTVGDVEYACKVDLTDPTEAAITDWAAARATMTPAPDTARHQVMYEALLKGGGWGEYYNTNRPVDTYAIGSTQLREFTVIDPMLMAEDYDAARHPANFEAYVGTEFPPHPAQVLALSYLAHSAMMVAGWLPPWERRLYPVDERRDSDGAAYNDVTNDPDLAIFGTDLEQDYLAKSQEPWYREYSTGLMKDVKALSYVDPAKDMILIRNDNADNLADVVANLSAGEDYTAIGYLDPDVSDPERFAQMLLAFHPGDCIWLDYDDPATADIDERQYVYEVASQRQVRGSLTPLANLDTVVIPPQCNSSSLAADVPTVVDPAAHPLAVQLFIRRVFKVDYHKGLIHEETLDTKIQGSLSGVPTDAVNIVRVANYEDIRFARKIHEMSVRWAIAYASENPYDWGAPRPANRPTAFDQPLAMYDLFSFGSAAKRDAELATKYWSRSNQDPFYNWLQPANPQDTRFAHQMGNKTHRISNQAPIDVPPQVHQELLDDYYGAGGFHTSDDDTTATQPRFWALEKFTPSQRCRELVFWSVPWKDFEDSEAAPSAPMDMTQYDITQCLHVQDRSGESGKIYMHPSGRGHRFQHPEYGFSWDPDRLKAGGASDHRSGYWKSLGPFGADRNFNGRFDEGNVPKDSTMRAVTIARFTFYDPILRLHQEN